MGHLNFWDVGDFEKKNSCKEKNCAVGKKIPANAKRVLKQENSYIRKKYLVMHFSQACMD